MTHKVSLSGIKGAAIKFPEPVRSLILSEPDYVESAELISMMGTWEKLLMMAQNTGKMEMKK